MLKTTQSLNVNNSSSQTGEAHQTSQQKELIEKAIRTALNLEHQLDALFDMKFVQDMYFDEITESEHNLQSIINAISDMHGYVYTECIRKGVAL